jgi:phosphoglycerate dehydrogenase-like enzyme
MRQTFVRVAVALSVALCVPHIAVAAEDTAAVIAELGLRESAAPVRQMKGWQKPQKVVVLVDTPARLAWFKETVKDVNIVPVRGPNEARAHMADADALVGMCEADLIGAAPKLRWVQSQQAGVDACLPIPKLRDGSVMLSNMQRLNGPNISEHAMALMLALTRQINAYVNNQRDTKWIPRGYQRMQDVDGKTLLVVGLGGIGTDVAKRADAFGMRVIATRNSSREGPPFVDYVGLADELPKLIAEADIVINTTPLTPATTGIFNAAMFARMKPTAYFINVGRGQSVVTADLVDALKTKKIAGAALDVVDPEPLPASHPLWTIPNVIITPHVAGTSELRQDRAWIIMRENLRRYVAGEKIYSVVDVKKGY